ncbi:RNA polymerase Rpb4 [Candidatus Bathyarchaeota archaeon]|jgi:DNA-directed RNA polymerase subunit F|nr:MAG: RNA polymerase Rpb4 [Candidatus Bathyarchaeota archaeon]
MSQTIVNKKKITISEAKEILENVKDLNLYQLRIKEYVKKFSKIDPTMARELVDKLTQKFEIEKGDAISVVNCMPSSLEELRMFFLGGRKRLILTSQLEEMLKLFA